MLANNYYLNLTPKEQIYTALYKIFFLKKFNKNLTATKFHHRQNSCCPLRKKKNFWSSDSQLVGRNK